MPVFQVSGDVDCELCECELQINTQFGRSEGWGVCNLCGIIYRFEPSRPDKRHNIIHMVECQVKQGSFDWNLVKSYYESEGEPAVISGYSDFDQKVVEKFDEWANEKYEMEWNNSSAVKDASRLS